MADGGEGEFSSCLHTSTTNISVGADFVTAVGAVLKNWPHVFSILNLFGKLSEAYFL